MTIPIVRAHWDAPASVFAFVTTRDGGVSTGRYGGAGGLAGGLNLGDHVEDDSDAVRENRRRLPIDVPAVWLRQVHGDRVCDLDEHPLDTSIPQADAALTTRTDRACAILVADCMPVLFADRRARIVGAAHAGWRGLARGVLVRTVEAMRARVPDAELVAWIGPCIGQAAFEIGPEIREALLGAVPASDTSFMRGRGDRWHADLAAIAARQLHTLGLASVAQSSLCTFENADRFYSFRRDGTSGRFAAVVGLRQDGGGSSRGG